MNREEQTIDISSGGVCFGSQTAWEIGGRLEYVVTLSGGSPPVQIRCVGKVLRIQPAGETFLIAASLDRYQFVRPDRQPLGSEVSVAALV